MHRQQRETIGDVVPLGKEVIPFVKTLPAAGTSVAAFPVEPRDHLSLYRAIFDPLRPIVVDPVGERTAIRASTYSSLHLDRKVNRRCCMFHIPENHVFHIQQFCGKIILKHDFSPFL